MREFSKHSQTWHNRQTTIEWLTEVFSLSAQCNEVLFPCMAETGPTPLIAGRVVAPGESMDQAMVEVRDISNKKRRAFCLDVEYENPGEGGDWMTSGTYFLTPKTGIRKSGPAGKNTPMDFPDYQDIDEVLSHIVYTKEDSAQAVEQLGEIGELSDLDEYLRQMLMNRRQRMSHFLLELLDQYGNYGQFGAT